MSEIQIKTTEVEGAVESCAKCRKFVEIGFPAWAFIGERPVCPSCLREYDPTLSEVLAGTRNLKGGCHYTEEKENEVAMAINGLAKSVQELAGSISTDEPLNYSIARGLDKMAEALGKR